MDTTVAPENKTDQHPALQPDRTGGPRTPNPHADMVKTDF